MARNTLFRSTAIKWLQKYYSSGLFIIPDQYPYRPLAKVTHIGKYHLDQTRIQDILATETPDICRINPAGALASHRHYHARMFSEGAYAATVLAAKEGINLATGEASSDLLVAEGSPHPYVLTQLLRKHIPLLIRPS